MNVKEFASSGALALTGMKVRGLTKLRPLGAFAALGTFVQLGFVQLAHAQQEVRPPVADTSGVAKAAEAQRKPITGVQLPPKKTNSLSDTETAFAVDLLKEVRVNGDLLTREISDYWMPFLRKPVTAAQVLAFKQWVYDKLDDMVVLGFLVIKDERGPEGTSVLIQVVPITVGEITVLASDPALRQQYAKEVEERFKARFVKGQILDVPDMEAQLNAATFDLPVALDVELRTEASSADIFINMEAAPYRMGRLQSGSVQLNNYGLAQYGRGQALSVFRFDGLSPLSGTTLGAMVSSGVRYLRAEYDQPLIGTGKRVQVWASGTRSNTMVDAASANSSSSSEGTDVGLRLTGLLSVTGNTTHQWAAELARRDAVENTADTETGRYNDHQLKLRLKTDRSNSAVSYFNNEATLTAGVLDLSPNADNLSTDQGSYQRNGAYQKLELAGAASTPVTDDKTTAFSVRWRGQLASKNLNSYNKIALGGANGIRAYNAADGTGDSGAVLSFDLTKTFSPALRVGLLYDVGYIDLYKNPNVPGVTAQNSYTLQGAGFQLEGEVDKFTWNASVAKSFGAGQNTTLDSSLTPVGDWRFNLELSRSF